MAGPPDVRGLSRESAADRASVPMPARRWRSRVLVPAAIVAGVAALVLYSVWETIVPAHAVRAVAVIVKSVAGESPGSVTVQAPGWLEPDPHPFYAAALASGVVAEVLVLEGDTVAAGAVVARLIDDDAKLARERAAAALAEQRAAVAGAQSELEAAELTLGSLIDRTEAVQSTRAELAAVAAERVRVAAEIQAAESTALATEDELERKTRLVTSQAVARGEVARLRLRLIAEQATAAARRAAVPVLDAKHKAAKARAEAAARRAKLLIEERRDVGVAKARLAAARAAEQQAVTDLAIADLRLQRMNVTAPAAGRVMRRMVAPGSRVFMTSSEHSAHVLHLYDPQKLQVRVDVPLADAARVGVGQRAKIIVDAFPDRVFDGVVSRLVPLADVAKNTVEVKVAVRDPDPVLKPEMLARVRLLAAEAKAAGQSVRQRVFAPRRAVRGDGRVFVVVGLERGRGRVGVRQVELGPAGFDDFVEVVSGLRPGDRVIVDAPAGLVDQSRVLVTGEEK